MVLILVLVGYHDKYALYCFVVTVFLHSKRIKAYSMFFMFIFFKCLLIMTDCCFLFYLTKRENNISCTINLYKKSRNAGAINLKTNSENLLFFEKRNCILDLVNYRYEKQYLCIIFPNTAFKIFIRNSVNIDWKLYITIFITNPTLLCD